MSCVHDQIVASLDRWMEIHWQIHQIEAHYHNPDGVRFSFNALIRATKEIPQILLMELQGRTDYRAEIKPKIEDLKMDPLFSLLSAKRDYVVHRGMLEVQSTGFIGTTEGRGWKFGFSFSVYPWESSDEAYQRFLKLCKSDAKIRRLMGPDCDSSPMIERVWRLPDFPDKDFLEIAIASWRTAGNLLSDIIVHLGGEPLDTELSCTHDPALIRRKVYSQTEFFRIIDGIDVATGKRIG